MKVHHLYESLSGRVLLVILAIFFTLCVGHANSASEPGTVTIVVPEEPLNLDSGNTARRDVGPFMIKNVYETLLTSASKLKSGIVTCGISRGSLAF